MCNLKEGTWVVRTDTVAALRNSATSRGHFMFFALKSDGGLGTSTIQLKQDVVNLLSCNMMHVRGSL